MITPINALNIWDLIKRENDLLVSVEDIKEIEMNERKQISRFLPMCCQNNDDDDENMCTLSKDECFECMERTINNLDEYFNEKNMTEFDLLWTDEEKHEAEKEAYNQALEDLKFNLEGEKKTYAYNGHSLDTDKWLDSYLESKLGL